MQRAILWDLDGTIADTEAIHYRTWQRVLGARGIEQSYEQYLASFGRSNAELLPELLGPQATPEEIHALADEKEAVFRELLGQSALQTLPGVVGWLEHFRQRRVRQVISSSGPMANIAATVSQLGIADYFACLLSGAALPKGKPDPALFFYSAAAAGADPAHCLVIEDSLHGIEAARRAGMPSVAVGRIAAAPALAELLARVSGPDCIAVASLELLEPWSLAQPGMMTA
jgi:HAD superfamily hydrolase (TIGR01509 family)